MTTVRKKSFAKNLVLFAFLAPSLLAFLALQGIPGVISLGLSFTDWNIIDPPKFQGLSNYIALFSDSAFMRALKATAILTLGLEVSNTALGLLVALGLNRQLRFQWLFRTVYFLPLVTAWAAVAIVWRYLYSEIGPINSALGSIFGMDPIGFLSMPETGMASLLVTITWKTLGWKVIILLAGLQAIPRELYDASRIDGATNFQQFRTITLPLLTPSIFVAVIVGMINTLQIFDPIYIMTQGGPAETTKTIGFLIYAAGFEQLRLGYSAAISWVLFIAVMAATIFQWVMQKRWVFYD